MSTRKNGSAPAALDNARQDSTDIDMIDPLTGLTPQQQRAAYLLLSGAWRSEGLLQNIWMKSGEQ